MNAATKGHANKEKTIVFIDKRQFELDRDSVTVRELLTLAGEDPAETTLVLRHGNDLHKYTDPNESIDLKNGLHFVVFHNAPTPVS